MHADPELTPWGSHSHLRDSNPGPQLYEHWAFRDVWQICTVLVISSPAVWNRSGSSLPATTARKKSRDDADLAFAVSCVPSQPLFRVRSDARHFTPGRSAARRASRRQACKAAGVPEGTWQWLRRSWSVHAETLWMFSDPLIERVLGHTKQCSNRWYRSADVDNLTAIAPRISFGL